MAIVIKQYMVTMYAMLIKSGKRTIDEIPADYVESVVEELEKTI